MTITLSYEIKGVKCFFKKGQWDYHFLNVLPKNVETFEPYNDKFFHIINSMLFAKYKGENTF